eukprot:5449674-Lingulodinium_polyedra.AAC.1
MLTHTIDRTNGTRTNTRVRVHTHTMDSLLLLDAIPNSQRCRGMPSLARRQLWHRGGPGCIAPVKE